MSLTDNEMHLLRYAVACGLASLDEEEIDHLPFKVKKVFHSSSRWAEDPLAPDEDRRAPE